MSDHLFEYSLVSENSGVELEEPELFEVLFYDLFSETCSYLEQYGFQVKFQVVWIARNIRVNTGYIARIMDNITSNIVKYASDREPVVIGSLEGREMAGFFIENTVRDMEEKPESTGIGIQSIRNMMKKMGGKCGVSCTENRFRIEVEFPCAGEK